eukprot:101597-Chlamydomonas_euryale.AAC.3
MFDASCNACGRGCVQAHKVALLLICPPTQTGTQTQSLTTPAAPNSSIGPVTASHAPSRAQSLAA